MGFFNQGWMVRCDNCDGCLRGDLHGALKWEVTQEARDRGWVLKRDGRAYCCKECLEESRVEDHPAES